MGSELEFYEARLSHIRSTQEALELHFSYVTIHKTKGTPGRATGGNWSQEAVLSLSLTGQPPPMPTLPNTVVDGYLELGDQRHELISLPFKHEDSSQLHLEFSDGTIFDVRGEHPQIVLLGDKIFLN